MIVISAVLWNGELPTDVLRSFWSNSKGIIQMSSEKPFRWKFHKFTKKSVDCKVNSKLQAVNIVRKRILQGGSLANTIIFIFTSYLLVVLYFKYLFFCIQGYIIGKTFVGEKWQIKKTNKTKSKKKGMDKILTLLKILKMSPVCSVDINLVLGSKTTMFIRSFSKILIFNNKLVYLGL